MSNQLLASKVVVVEEEPRLRHITALPTRTLGGIGITERGPVGQPALVTSFEDFVATFGCFTSNSALALAASAFFENAGQVSGVSRTRPLRDPARHGAEGVKGRRAAAQGPSRGAARHLARRRQVGRRLRERHPDR